MVNLIKLQNRMFFLHDFKFNLAIANSKKTFDKFFARFTLVIAALDFIDCNKISNH